MRTTLNIDDGLMERASRLTGIKEKTALVRLGLEALIARESAQARQDGGDPEAARGDTETKRGMSAMVLVDDSVWVSHLKDGNEELAEPAWNICPREAKQATTRFSPSSRGGAS